MSALMQIANINFNKKREMKIKEEIKPKTDSDENL